LKYLRTYEDYKGIKSDKYGDELNQREWDELLQKHCKMYSDDNVKLYRGFNKFIDQEEIVGIYQKPNIRKSIEPQQIHVITMSGMESWKDYPPYNKSIIGSTDFQSAKGYGKLYEIIPYDNTKVGLCPVSSVWESFGGFGGHDAIRIIDNFLKKWIVDPNHQWSTDYNGQESWSKLKEKILNINVKEKIEKYFPTENDFKGYIYDFFIRLRYWMNKNKLGFSGDYNDLFSDKIIEESKLYTAEDIVNYIEFQFDPNVRGFNWIKYDKNFNKNIKQQLDKLDQDNREGIQIWCEGPVLLKKRH